MVGFPGESEDAAAETRAACERIGFAWLHVFRYSVRPETRAASMPQLAEPLKAERALRLREVGARLHAGFLAGQSGREAELLVERIADGHAEGITREHVRARIGAMTGLEIGDLVHVRLREGSSEPLPAEAV
jgi:threonylcarbamoyladenosine tRNA methylthiotransferase MtaB